MRIGLPKSTRVPRSIECQRVQAEGRCGAENRALGRLASESAVGHNSKGAWAGGSCETRGGRRLPAGHARSIHPACFDAPARCATLVGDIPLATSRYRLGTLAAITLVALRLGIGWHFFREGTDKIQDPSWTAAHFFTGSKGPLHPLFEMLVWDVDGKARLNYARTDGGWPTIDLEPDTVDVGPVSCTRGRSLWL